MFCKLLLLLIFSLFTLGPAQLDTAGMGDNTWVDKSPAGYSLSVNGSNWAYENDFKGDPFFGYFVMGPGHVIHPQDCYFFPYDPIINKWYKINPPNKQPRQCLSAFAISSQDSVIMQVGCFEGSHQLSQGGFADDYKSILSSRGRGIGMWAYSFNRNQWTQMRGPTTLPAPHAANFHEYDPVHDITLSHNFAYSFHNNTTVPFTAAPAGITNSFYSIAVDTRRGITYILSPSGFYKYDPETTQWSTVPGTYPAHPDGPDQADGICLSMLAYDERHDVLIFACPPGATTWAFDCATLQWTNMSPSVAPTDMGRFAYCKALNCFMLLGGSTKVGGSTRGGSVQGIWLYRYKKGGADAYDAMAAAPKTVLNLNGGTARLNWSRISENGVTGYNIYRGTANPYPKGFAKLNSSPVTDTFYTDASAVSATKYSYRVCAVKNGVEGKLSRHCYTQPYRVLNAMASVEDSVSHVRVTWDANPEQDLLGYNIYRASGASIYTAPMTAGYTKLNSSPVNALEYWDTVNLLDHVARGYVVTAVNAFGLESGVSGECTTYPNAPEMSYTIQQSVSGTMKNVLRWKPPRRTRIIGVNFYQYTATLQNTAGLIKDSVTNWDMPTSSGTDAYSLLFQTYYVRSVNVLGDEGFMTDQISPINSEFGPGQVYPTTLRFNYGAWSGQPSVVEEGPDVDSSANTDAPQIFPNPFNPSLNVSFYLAGSQSVKIGVYDMQGRLLRSFRANRGAGRHAESFDMTPFGSGVYLVKTSVKGRTYQKKAVLVK